MFKSLVLACLQAYLAMAEQVDEFTCFKVGGRWHSNCQNASILCDQKTDGSEWDQDTGVCLSPEQAERACVNDGGEWQPDADVPKCKTAYDFCKELTDGSEWDFYGKGCQSPEELCWDSMWNVWRNGSCVPAKPFAEICLEEGNEWAYFEGIQGCGPAEDLRRDCKNAGGKWTTEFYNGYGGCESAEVVCGSKLWDKVNEVCLSPEEAKEACVDGGSVWGKNDYGDFVCKTAEELCKDKTDGSIWAIQTEVCLSPEDLCVESFGEWRNGSCVTMEELADICFEEGNEWAYVKDIPVCRPAEDLRRDCKNAGDKWQTDFYNGYGGCKPAEDACEQKYDGSTWDSDTGVCLSPEEAVVTSLAQADAQTKSNYSNTYTGAAFGAVGLAATFFLVSTCNKKEVSERQSFLLDGYQSANHL